MTVNPFKTSGRMRRTTYLAVVVAINAAVAILQLAIVGAETRMGPSPAHQLASLMVSLAAAWPLACAMSQRLHDAGHANATLGYAAVSLMLGARLATGGAMDPFEHPFASSLLAAGVAIALWIVVAPPQRRRNRHGPDPRRSEVVA